MDNQRQATTDIIARTIKSKYMDPRSKYNPRDIQRDLKQNYGVTIDYQKAWRSREKNIRKY